MTLNERVIQQIRKRREQTRKRGRPKKPAVWLFPNPVIREYNKDLQQYVSVLQNLVRNIILPQIDSIVTEAAMLRPDGIVEERFDDWADKVAALIQAVTGKFKEQTPSPERIARNVGYKTQEFNKNQFGKVVRSVIGVDVLISEPWLGAELNSFTKENISLIENIPQQSLTQIEGAVQRGIRQGASAAVIKREIVEKLGMAERRAEIIARDQVGKLNGQLTHFRQKEVGIDQYTWRTAQDERTRPSHAAREGVVYSWNDSPRPGEESLCRCYAEPIVDGLLDLAENGI